MAEVRLSIDQLLSDPSTFTDSMSIIDGIFVATEDTKLPIILVGLPVRGKTFMGQRLKKYLNWINISTEIYTVSEFRRKLPEYKNVEPEFFNPKIEENMKIRREVTNDCLDQLISDLKKGTYHVGILDGTNLNQERREIIYNRLKQETSFSEPVFICVDCSEEISKQIFYLDKMTEQEHEGKENSIEFEKYQKKINYLQSDSEPLENLEWSFIKIYRRSEGSNFKLNRIHGYIQTKIVTFLMNLHPVPKTIYVSRHGESEYNVENKVGGDPDLSSKGKIYAEKLAQEVAKISELKDLVVWTSTLQRTQKTAHFIKCKKSAWKALDEIDAGKCDGMTYTFIEQNRPEIFRERKEDKLTFRYPNGESYIDLINRLEPVILEIERMREPLLIVSHQAVIRCLRAYFEEHKRNDVPNLDIPLHTLMKFTLRSSKSEHVFTPIPLD